jgi:hypothetical protein
MSITVPHELHYRHILYLNGIFVITCILSLSLSLSVPLPVSFCPSLSVSYILSVDITGSAFGLNAEDIPHLVDRGAITDVHQGSVSSPSTVSMFQLCHNLRL